MGWDHVIVSFRRKKPMVRIDGTSEVSIRKTHRHRSTRREACETWTRRIVLNQPRIRAMDTRDGVERWSHGMRRRRCKMRWQLVAKRTIGASIGAVREAGLRWSGTDQAHLRRIRTDEQVAFVRLSSTSFLRTYGILACLSFATWPSTTHARDPPSPPPCPRGVYLPRSLPPPADAPCFVLRSSPSAPHGPVSAPGVCDPHPVWRRVPGSTLVAQVLCLVREDVSKPSLPRANPHEPGFNRRVKRNPPSNRTRTSIRSNPVETRRRWTNPKAAHAEDANGWRRGSSAGVVRFVGDSNPRWW